MCGRYYIDTDDMHEQIKAIISEVEQKHGNSEAHAQMKLGEVFPTNVVPIVAAQGAALMRWGYAGYKKRVINARSETAFEKPMFRKSLIERRCLIPASGYYEWRRNNDAKQRYALFRRGRPLYMAGIWREEQGEDLPAFVILTREAGKGIAIIHNRMPVILQQDDCEAWLRMSGDPGAIMDRAIEGLEYVAK